jgi:hypothetical protein
MQLERFGRRRDESFANSGAKNEEKKKAKKESSRGRRREDEEAGRFSVRADGQTGRPGANSFCAARSLGL